MGFSRARLGACIACLAAGTASAFGTGSGPAAVSVPQAQAGTAAGTPAGTVRRPLPEIPQGGKVTIVPVNDTIDLGLAPFLARVIDEQGDRDVLVLDVNTLGGRVDAAIVIRDALLHARARTVCWINPRAISAGALISLACDVIAVAPGATIGAATPVQIGEGGEMKSVEAKVVSYMRSEMRATAEAKGRRGDIAEAMVDADLEIAGLDEKGKLLTLDGSQALTWGIAELEAADEAQLWRGLGIEPARVERPQISWAEKLARFLSDPVVSGLLMTLGMLGILIELYSGGHGVALLAGLSCLALFFFGHHVAQLAGWEEILLFVVGAGLLGFEILVPGHILPGVAGVILLLTSLIMALVNLENVPIGVAWSAGWLPSAMATVFGSVLVTAFATWGLAKVLPKTRFGRPLILDATLPRMASTAASPVGKDARAATDLRPSGKILLDGERVEARAERGLVVAGTPVRVVRVEGSQLVVREVEPDPRPDPAKEGGS